MIQPPSHGVSASRDSPSLQLAQIPYTSCTSQLLSQTQMPKPTQVAQSCSSRSWGWASVHTSSCTGGRQQGDGVFSSLSDNHQTTVLAKGSIHFFHGALQTQKGLGHLGHAAIFCTKPICCVPVFCKSQHSFDFFQQRIKILNSDLQVLYTFHLIQAI